MTVYVVATTPADPSDFAVLARLAKKGGWSQVRSGTLDLPSYAGSRTCVAAEVERDLVRRPRPKKRLPARKAADV